MPKCSTKMTIDEMIAVLQALKDGKQVQYRTEGRDWTSWVHVRQTALNFDSYEYRVAPPQPREFWVNAYETHNESLIYSANETREAADRAAGWTSCHRIECIHVREVMEEQCRSASTAEPTG